MIITEITYPGHDNDNRLLLSVDGVAYDLAAITQMDLKLPGRTISSDNGAGEAIRWDQPDYETGEVRFFLGTLNPVLAAGFYEAYLVVYDAAHLNGLVWGKINLRVIAVA